MSDPSTPGARPRAWARPGEGKGRRHAGAAVALLVPAIVATMLVFIWTGASVAVMAASAAILWAGGLGCLTRTTAGRWAGRLGGAVLVIGGGWVAWYTFVLDTSAWRFLTYIYGVPIATVLLLDGMAVLLALRPRAGTASGTGT